MKTLEMGPFIESCQFILNEVTGLEFSVGEVFEKTSPFNVNESTVLFGVLGNIKGQVSFTMKKEVAHRITTAMLVQNGLEETEEFVSSAISEFGNMIMGNAANKYFKKGIAFDITPPSILTGDNLSFSVEKVQIACIPFRFSDGSVMEVNFVYKFI